MTDGRWPKGALVAVLVAIALFVPPNFLVLFGALVELVMAVSNLSLLALLVALVPARCGGVHARALVPRSRGIALTAEIVAALLLFVQEPQPD